MGRNKRTEIVRIRFKELADGKKSIYLDTYFNGKRKYEFLKLYLVPEKNKEAVSSNKKTLKQAELIKGQRLQEIEKDTLTDVQICASNETPIEPETPVINGTKKCGRPPKMKTGIKGISDSIRQTSKDSVTLRSKELANGGKSLYLDFYYEGQRRYEFLKLYLIPELTSADKTRNRQTLLLAEEIKEKRIREIAQNGGNIDMPEATLDCSCDDEENEKTTTKNFAVVHSRKLRNGNRSLFLDIIYNGERAYEALGLYIAQTDNEEKRRQTMAKAESMKKKRLKEMEEGTFVRKERHPKEVRTDKFKEYMATKKVVSEIAVAESERKRNKMSKEPVRIRFKQLANGNKSVYLSINVNGRRTYDYLKMYLVPETDANAKMQNKMTMQAVYAIKSQRIIDITNGAAGIKDKTRTKMRLVDCWRYSVTGRRTKESNRHITG